MQRTYKSKKSTGGGLDHRDMLFNMDEKSSVFDAFYIQNIKQTKREQSCLGSSNNYRAITNRVRKRKYVKRLVKEVECMPKESLCESVSGSAFLTPDKSIHVNKGPDLFDQLLNSSPACLEVKHSNKMDVFDQIKAATPKETKTYNRKKKLTKKLEYSSNESSVSDKENSNVNGNSTQNMTNIKSHELMIEKEAVSSPKFDESINNIVRKLSLINNINHMSASGSVRKAFKYNKNRLTKNIHSPFSKTSPLSSTPFMDKIRNKSIYNFSPIPMGDLTESPKCATVMEDDNEVNKSVVFVPKNISSSLKRSQDKEEPPVIESSGKCKGHSNPLFSSDADTHDEKYNNNASQTPLNAENKNLICSQPSFLHTSEMEPFLGFSVEIDAKENNELEEKDNSIIISTGKYYKSSQRSKEISIDNIGQNDNSKEVSKNIHSNSSIIEHSITPEPYLVKDNETVDDNDNLSNKKYNDFETNLSPRVKEASKNTDLSMSQCNEINSSDKEDHKILRNNDSDEEQNDSFLNKSVEGNTMSSEPKLNYNTPNITVDMDDYDEHERPNQDSEDNISLSSFSSHSIQDNQTISDRSKEPDSEYEENQSCYDTCDSNSYLGDETKLKVPVFELERSDKDILNNYNENIPVHSKELVDMERMSINSFNIYDKNIPEDYKEPLVAINRMDMDLFQKYYEIMPNYNNNREENSSENINEEMSDEYTSFDSETPDEKSEQNSQSTNAENDITSTVSDLDSFSEEVSCSENKDKTTVEEACVSFVTTRRKNEYTIDSTILVLDDTQEDVNSDCDNTVLSKRLANPKQEENVTIADTSDEHVLIEKDITENYSNETKSTNLRNSPSIAKTNLDISKTRDSKLGINLLPGKKWKRSLSIYRRMTMENQYDHSVLEDMHSRGKSYSQSVINTTEQSKLFYLFACVISHYILLMINFL